MKVKVKGMKCMHCVKRVEDVLKNNGAKNVSVSLEENTASFESLEVKTAISLIENIGYKAKKVKL